MWHGVKKIKFRSGKDANKSLMTKLVKNFIINAKLETTFKKIKAVKPIIERLVEKSKQETEANRNVLKKILNNEVLVGKAFKEIGSNFKDKVGGYVRIVRLGTRNSDGSETARLEWTNPVLAQREKEKRTKVKKIPKDKAVDKKSK